MLTCLWYENFSCGSITFPQRRVLNKVLDLLSQHIPENLLHPRQLFESNDQDSEKLLPPPVDVNKRENERSNAEDNVFQAPDPVQHDCCE